MVNELTSGCLIWLGVGGEEEKKEEKEKEEGGWDGMGSERKGDGGHRRSLRRPTMASGEACSRQRDRSQCAHEMISIAFRSVGCPSKSITNHGWRGQARPHVCKATNAATVCRRLQVL